MPPEKYISATEADEIAGGDSAAIEVSALGNRRALEAVYLEIHDLAKKSGPRSNTG